MKHINFLRCAWLATALLATTAACAHEASIAPAGWDADEAAIRTLLGRSVEAFNRGDLPGHLAIYDADVHFMTRTGPRAGVAPIEKAFRETYFQPDGKPKQQLRFEQLAIRPVAPNVAIATARYVLSGGAEKDKAGWFTLVWTRTSAGWKAIHDHSS